MLSMAADDVDPARDPIVGDVDGGGTCDFGSVVGDVYGRVIDFGHGVFLPRGRYRVAYVDGCMKYNRSQDWALHAYPLGAPVNDRWWLVSGNGKIVMAPGTVGFEVGSGGFATFDECVRANLALPPIEFDFSGGRIGVLLQDTPYQDNLPGDDGRSPTWRLTALRACEPVTRPSWG
jgi:hypothetical protein